MVYFLHACACVNTWVCACALRMVQSDKISCHVSMWIITSWGEMQHITDKSVHNTPHFTDTKPTGEKMKLNKLCRQKSEQQNSWLKEKEWECIQLVQHWIRTPLMQVRLPGVTRDISPRVNFQCRLSNGVHTHPCAITRINICVHVKGPLVHVRVWWITETVRHLVCTVG